MRKLARVFVIAGTLIPLAVAQGQSLSRLLTVEVQSKAYGSAWIGTSSLGVSALAEVGEIRTWRGFMGGLPLSEAEFYRSAGYPDVAEKVKSYRSTADCLTFGGATTAVVGLVMLAVGFARVNEDPDDQPHVTLAVSGVVLAFGGLGVELVGAKQRSQNLTPASFAAQVAEEHNRRFRQEREKP